MKVNQAVLKTLFTSLLFLKVNAWGNSNSNGYSVDPEVYGKSLSRDWIYDASGISLKLEGCVWGYVEDNEDSGCLESSSEDGTYYWYQMSNCRRAQAVVSVYATSSGGYASCNSGNFKESFVTKNGLGEFLYLLSVYDANSGFSGSYGYYNNGGNGNGNGNGNNGGYYGNGNLPMCEQADGYYIGVGCASDGTFSLEYFDDAYCMNPTGQTYDKLNSVNSDLKKYRQCSKVDTSSNNNGMTVAQALVRNANSCSQLDSDLCGDNSAMESRRSTTSNRMAGRFNFGGTWVTKLKYFASGLLLLASFIMFTGILFTNRRRRRALMQRKYRQRKSEERSRKSSKSRSGSKSRSKSKSRDGKSSRSRSRSKKEDTADAGVFT